MSADEIFHAALMADAAARRKACFEWVIRQLFGDVDLREVFLSLELVKFAAEKR